MTSIWFKPLSLEQLNQRGENTMTEFLGIEFIEITDNSLKATMPVSARTKQPLGIVHGGANVVLAETLASVAANSVVDIEHYYCVGLEINANHIRPVQEGMVTGISKPIHLGKSTQIWHIELFNPEGKISCISRMTAAIIARETRGLK